MLYAYRELLLKHRRSGEHKPLFAANRVHFVRENETESEEEKEVFHEVFFREMFIENLVAAQQHG